jgi:mannose-6-phosphate isomerase-like protein (cupin superfamily)
VGVVTELSFQPIADARDPDDWRPNSRAAFVSDPVASMAVIVEQIAVGDWIPLHVHGIDEAIFFDGGTADVRVGELRRRVGAGAIAVVPAGVPHTTVNAGNEPVRLKAAFPSHVVDIGYRERVPAPGTEADDPRPPVAYDMRAGEIVPIPSAEPADAPPPSGTVFESVEPQPMTNDANPDDWRPGSRVALVADPVASLAIAVQEIGVGEGGALHVHSIDEVFFVEGGRAEFRLGEDVARLSAGAIVFAPAGMPHAARNVGDEPLSFRALFSSHLVDLRYLGRNPAPGTEGRHPRTVVYDAHSAATQSS